MCMYIIVFYYVFSIKSVIHLSFLYELFSGGIIHFGFKSQFVMRSTWQCEEKAYLSLFLILLLRPCTKSEKV